MKDSDRAGAFLRPKVRQEGWWDLVCAIFWCTLGSCMLLPWLLGSCEQHVERHLLAGAVIGTYLHFDYNRRQREKAKELEGKSRAAHGLPGDQWRGSNNDAGGGDGGFGG